MKNIAYIRVSTVDQNTARQLDGLTFDKSFTDKLSGSNKERPALLAMLDYIREDDVVWVHSIDRLARSLIDLHSIVKEITDKGATIHFKTENLTFDAQESAPHQTLHFNMLGAFAQFERSLIKQRQKEGIAKAKANGAYLLVGRNNALLDDKVVELRLLKAQGVPIKTLVTKFGISRSSVYKYLKD